MKKATITVGVSASGKSTWAQEQITTDFGVRIVERDAIRREIFAKKNEFDVFTWPEWKWKWEDEVTAIQREQIVQHSLNPYVTHLIISDTNLDKKRREEMKVFLEHLGFEVEIRRFDVTWQEANKRDTLRFNGVGYSVLAQQFEKFHEYLREESEHLDPIKFWAEEEKLAPLPRAILVDIDGTLAHMNGRKPFDWDRVDEDVVDLQIRRIVNSYAESGFHVIALSGRDGCCAEKTAEWLKKNKVKTSELIMRASGDMRPDEVVKLELFKNFVMGHFRVVLVIDDRPKVVRMWQSLGLKTLTCGNPWKEF